MCFNHNTDSILARTTSGTLRLEVDDVGLRFAFEAPNTTLGSDMLELVRLSLIHILLDDAWQKCIGTTAPADLKGCACWGGLDLSNVSDITAYVLLFHENDRFQLLPHFWIPEEKMREKIRKENINYDKWVAEGYVTVTPGNVIDYDFVKARCV